MRLILAAFVISILATPAGALIDGDGDLNHDEVTIVLRVDLSPDVSAKPPSQRGHSPIRYEAVPVSRFPTSELNGLRHLCDPGGSDVIDPAHAGWKYWIYIYERSTGELVNARLECVPLPDPNDTTTPPPPPPLPEPPTVEEIWARADLHAPAINVNPNGTGITGLETWLWTDSAESKTISVSLAGYTITGTATPVGYAFDTGDGTPTLSTAPGTEANPAVRHIYETKGNYTLYVSRVWTAQATLTGPDITTPITIDLGTATITASRDYQVREIVTRLTR